MHRAGGDAKAPVEYVAQRVESRGELVVPSVKTGVEGQPKIGIGQRSREERFETALCIQTGLCNWN